MDSPKPGKILIVDDEVSIADTLGAIFSNQGYETRVAYSAEQSIEIIAQWKPELAITDVVLPVMSGIESCDSAQGKISVHSSPFDVEPDHRRHARE
jgi:CheY-like chemotaxis protein